ncbi:hypothetical protein GCM10029978_067730 [Actinoallomurus acanthiterrae]
MTTHVVQFSGGIGSFSAAQRVAEKYGTDRMVLLFADTLVEDPDLYRFLIDSGRYFGIKPTVVADGRTPFEVFRDQRFLGNSRIAPCSHHLKQKPCRTWLEEHHAPGATVLYIGIDRSEARRVPPIEKGWAPWRTRYPMCDAPFLSKEQMLDAARASGVKPPKLYEDGFTHNNCGGVCVRAGQRHWALLLRTHPDRFLEAERQEQEIRAELGDVAILRVRVGGKSRPLTLHELRMRIEASSCGIAA